MKIQIENYTISQSPDAPTKFDLTETVIAKKKETKEEYEKENTLGYAMTLERCVMIIVSENMIKDESRVSLGEFLRAFKLERERIEKLLK